MVEIEFKGLDDVTRPLEATPALVQRVYDGRTSQAMNEARRRLQRYPSPPAGSKYRRTFRLREGWAGAAQRRGVFVRALSNDVEYAPYVQGDRQARVHQGRFATVDQVVEALDIDGLTDDMERDLARLLGGR